ncbi:DEKNAAC105559 [Brettanomyces naardenensis]|uniref:DEKNAAC105559 n=1 Tax=Brettanomyces naardenensis TaxID=13370 RepID=A0A448YTR4_BRENA|nr:DEKNAAC105559 [Brettanomyces naardenensis]
MTLNLPSALVGRHNVSGSSRKKQAQKDAKLRKMIRHDLKRHGVDPMIGQMPDQGEKPYPSSSELFSSRSTVISLSPSVPVHCKPTDTVLEAAQLMSLTKENCVLAVDETGDVSGILTAKDLAFRVVGSDLDASVTTVQKIMTSDPMCALHTTTASDALNLMVVKKFRHLPIVDATGRVAGLLDITKCYNKAMDMLEAMYNHSRKLYSTMDNVNLQLGESGNHQSLYIVKYFDGMKKLLTGPTLREVINESKSSAAIYCEANANVFEAAVLMKRYKTTAVLIRERRQVCGIFTSKDIVLRVIAAGLNPKTCIVSSVMTPNPSYGKADDSISSAMRMLSEGGYLNLPVLDGPTIIGVVDVITLTRRSLVQIQTLKSINDDNEDDQEDDFEESDHNIGKHNISQSELNQFDISDDLLLKGKLNYFKECSVKVKLDTGAVFRFRYNPSRGHEGLEKLILSRVGKEVDVYDHGRGRLGLVYLDEDGDSIGLSNDQDLRDCLSLLQSLHRDRIDLFVHMLANDDEKEADRSTFLISTILLGIITSTAVAYAVYRQTNMH